MPIRADLRKYYGAEWRKLRAALIERHGPFCSECKIECAEYLNLCHVLRDPASGLVCLMCPRCHATYDSPINHALARRTRARKVGQLWLMPEIEFAPVALSEIPQRALAAMRRGAQRKLFE